MDKKKEKLYKVMSKIANYVPWQEEKVNEADFKILNNASGADLAESAYTNRINIALFIKNSKMLIDEYNERLLLNRIHDVSVLQRSLQSTFSLRIDKIKPISQAHVQPVSSDLLSIDNELIRRNVFTRDQLKRVAQLGNGSIQGDGISSTQKETGNFVANLQIQTSENLPSLHRNISLHPSAHLITDDGAMTDDQRKAPSILMHPQDNLLDFNDDNDFEEANYEVLSKMGLFDGDNGSRLFNTLENQKTLGNVAIVDDNLLQEVPQVESNIPSPLEIPEEIVEPEQETHLPQNSDIIDSAAVPHQEPSILEVDVFAQRYENFRLAIEQAEKLIEHKKLKRKPKRVDVKPSENKTEEELKFHKILRTEKLSKKLKKNSRIRPITTIEPISALWMLDDDVQFFLNNQFPFLGDEIEEMRMPSPAPQQMKRVQISPQIQPIAKRVRSDDFGNEFMTPKLRQNTEILAEKEVNPTTDSPLIDEVQNTLQNEHSHNENVREFSNINYQNPKNFVSSTPIAAPITTAQEGSGQNDFETFSISAARLETLGRKMSVGNAFNSQHINDARLILYKAQSEVEASRIHQLKSTLHSTMNEQAMDIEPNEIQLPFDSLAISKPVGENEKTKKRSRKTMKSRLEAFNVELKSIPQNNEEFEMNAFLLYVQIRIIMKKNCGDKAWKMTIPEFIVKHIIEANGMRSPFAITGLIKALEARGYLIANFSKDSNRREIIEIEVPLSRREVDSSEKENLI